MAITPFDAKKYSEEETSILHKMEIYTDNFLKNNYFNEPVRISTQDYNKYGYISQKIKTSFIDRYQQSGWVVKIQTDPVDTLIQHVVFSVDPEIPRSLSSSLDNQ